MSGAQAAVAETTEQIQAAEALADEDLSAGFGKPEAPASDKPKPAEASTTGGAEPAKKEETAPAPAEVKPVLINGMPEAEWNAAVARAAGPLIEQARAETRKNFGQIGEMNKALKEIRDTIAAGGSTVSRKKLTAEALKRVNEELPGLGDALAADLAEYLDSPAVAAAAATAKSDAESKGQTFDTEAFFNTKIGPALAQLETRANERAELRIVKSMHRDFDVVVRSPEFGAWLGTLSAEEQTNIRDSEDGFVAADAVTNFKAARDAQVKAKAKNETRLRSALTPSGDRQLESHIAIDDEAAFETGYNQRK
jgi:hypothetical protein